MENWEQILIDRGYKSLDDADKKAVKALLAQAWKDEILKRCQEAQPWDIEQLNCPPKLAPESKDKRYYRAPGGNTIYKPVDRDGIPIISTRKEEDPAEVEAFHDMLERRLKTIFQHGRVSTTSLQDSKPSMSFKSSR